MKRTKILLSVVLVCFSISLAKAQPTTAIGAVQQQENAQRMTQQEMLSLKAGTNAPAIYEGEESDVGPQHILHVASRRTHFQVRADSEYLYTDNAFQAPRIAAFGNLFKAFPGTIFVNTLSFALAPEPYRLGNGRFAPTVGLQNQWFNYAIGGPNGGTPIDLSVNNFDAETAFIGGRYLLPSDWTLYGRFEYNRFVNQANYLGREFYYDFVPTVGAQKMVKLRDDMMLTFDIKGDYHDSWTKPSPFIFGTPPLGEEDRADLTADLTLNYRATSRLVLQPYGRVQYTYYRYDTTGSLQGRNDQTYSLGAAAIYYFTEGLSLRCFFNQDMRQSSDRFAKYHAYYTGAELNYTLRF